MSHHSKHDLTAAIVKAQATKSFSGEKPLRADTEQKQLTLLAQCKHQLMKLPQLRPEQNTWYDSRGNLDFHVVLDARHISDVHIRLQFDKKGRLCLTKRYHGTDLAKVSNMEEIAAFADALRKASIAEDRRYEKLAFDAVKKEKIKSLKEQAIVAKIRELCAAEQVSYILETGYLHKMKLLVRLSDAERMEVDIPFASYQNILQNLQTAIQSFRELLAKNVVIKVKSNPYLTPRFHWTQAKAA